jgi:hypothetical protein
MGLVQSVTGSFRNQTTLGLTLTGVSSSNALILVLAATAAPGTPTGFSVGVDPTANGSAWAGVYYDLAPSSGTNAVTVGWTGTQFGGGVLIEWSGLAATPLDVTNSANASTAEANSVATGALGQASEVIFASLSVDTSSGVANAAISDPPSGFTSLFALQDTNNDQGVELAYKIVSSAASVTASWTWTDSSTSLSQAAIASFKLAGAAPATSAGQVPQRIFVLP